MVVLLDKNVAVPIGQIRRIWTEGDITHIAGEWGNTFVTAPGMFDKIIEQLTVKGLVLDCRTGAPKVTEGYVNGSGVPVAATEAPKPKGRPKAEPAAPVPPLDKVAVVDAIIAMCNEKGGEVYTAWSHYLSEKHGSKFGLAGLKEFPDERVVSFNNKIVESFRDGKLYPWDVDTTYPKPQLPGDGSIPDDDDEGFGDASLNGPPELYEAPLARLVVEMAEMSKETLDSFTATLNKAADGKIITTADPMKMLRTDLDKVNGKLDEWHVKGKLQPLSETATKRIAEITEPFADD